MLRILVFYININENLVKFFVLGCFGGFVRFLFVCLFV